MTSKKTSIIGDLVACLWRDAHGTVKDEFSSEDIGQATSYHFTTYGILVRDDRESKTTDPLIAIAAEISDDGRYRGVTFIPAGMVLYVKRLGGLQSPLKPNHPKMSRSISNKQLPAED